MPVYTLACPDCGHVFLGSVFPGTKPPEVWICSQCRGDRGAPLVAASAPAHPWDGDAAGCGCCS